MRWLDELLNICGSFFSAISSIDVDLIDVIVCVMRFPHVRLSITLFSPEHPR